MDKVKPDQNAQAAFEALAGCIAQQAATIKTLRTDNAGSPALPSGIVVASTVACSDLTNGPWSAFTDGAGRFIIGAGAHSNHDLSSYAVFGDKVSGWQEAIGGEEMVTLTMDEMPRHTHRIDMFYGREFDGTGGATPQGGDYDDAFVREDVGQTKLNGADQPHNNMPPYIALYYCKKD